MAHRSAPLSELGRLRLARAIVDQGWPAARAAERFQVSRPTAAPGRTRRRWSARSSTYAGPNDLGRPRSPPSRPGSLDRARGLGPLPHQSPGPAGPGHRPAHPPLRTRPPGDLIHVDVKKLGNSRPGVATGSWAAPLADQPPADRSSGRTSRHRNPLHGHGFIHAAVDDHSWLAYAEIHPTSGGRPRLGPHPCPGLVR